MIESQHITREEGETELRNLELRDNKNNNKETKKNRAMKPHRNVGRDHTTKVVLIQNIVDEKKENALERNNKVNTESTSKKAEASKNKAKEGSDPCRNVDRGGEDPCQTPEPTEAEATMVKKHRNKPSEMARDNKHYELKGASGN